MYEKIIEWMTKLDNNELLEKINGLKCSRGTVFYHHLCELGYLNDYNKIIADTLQTSWHHNRNIHKSIFNNVVLLIEEEVLKKNLVYYYLLFATHIIMI